MSKTWINKFELEELSCYYILNGKLDLDKTFENFISDETKQKLDDFKNKNKKIFSVYINGNLIVYFQ